MSAVWDDAVEVGEPERAVKAIPGDTRMFDVPTVDVPPPEPMMVRGSVKVEIQWEADIASLARHYADEYAAHPPANMGYSAAVDKGSTFLWDLIAENLDATLIHDDHGLRVTYEDDPEVEFTWTRALQAELDERLAR